MSYNLFGLSELLLIAMTLDLEKSVETVSALIAAGKLDEAAQRLKILCDTNPQQHRLKYQLGSVYYHLDQLENAFECYFSACLEAPLEADYHLALGLAAFGLKRNDEALLSFFRTSVLDSNNMDAVTNMGACYFERDDFERARRCFDLASQGPSVASQTLVNLGVCLGRLGQHQEAVRVFDRALANLPADPKAYAFRGVALHRLGSYQAAVESYQKALVIDAGCAPARLNWGITCIALEEMNEAVVHLREAMSLSGNVFETRWNLSMALLAVGQYEEGFALYDARLNLLQQKLFRTDPASDAPLLQCGEPIAGKTIYVFDEQGLGDAIQFARYLPMLKALGARVVARISASLVDLLGQMDAVDVWVSDQEVPPPHDVKIPLMSLAHFFNTRLATVPCAKGYLKAAPDRCVQWLRRLSANEKTASKRLRIGLIWAGNPMNPNDSKRSIPLPLLLSLLPKAVGDVQWIALTNAMSVDDEKMLATDGRVLDLCREIRDFSDTAALISLCDRVVAVDTSVAHLAGAMGVKTDLLISRAPDWRWGLGKRNTEWYESVSLHRQLESGEWAPVLIEVFGNDFP